MQICLSDFLKQDDISKDFQVKLDADHFDYWGESYPILPEQNVVLSITHKGERKISVTGYADLTLKMRCSRCLDEVKVPFHLELNADFDLNTDAKEEDELPFLTGYDLDVDLFVFDELIVNMPINVLCKEDCAGICQKCGKNLNEGPCDCDNTELDPRMAKILDIFNAMNKEV